MKRFCTIIALLLAAVTCHAQYIISTIAGNTLTEFIGDGYPATNYALANPQSICRDLAGNFYIADYENLRIRKLSADYTISTIAGDTIPGYTGDGGPASAARFQFPMGVCLDTADNLYITDPYYHVIRKITAATGIISTVAGSGTGGFGGDGGPATLAKMEQPGCAATDKAGNIFIPDYGNHRIRMVEAATGNMYTIAGTGTAGYAGDGGLATNALLSYPVYACTDTEGNVYFSEHGNHTIRKITRATGIISTVAGTGTYGFTGDNGPATAARLDNPNGVYADKQGHIYISDLGNYVIREINAAGTIYTIAGNGTYGFFGDGGPATAASFRGTTAVIADDTGTVYVVDGVTSVVRKITAPPTRVQVLTEDALTLWPNPAHTSCEISLAGNHEPAVVALYNTLGQVAWRGPLTGAHALIDLSPMPEGLYVLEITTSGTILRRKLVVVK